MDTSLSMEICGESVSTFLFHAVMKAVHTAEKALNTPI